MSVPVPASGVPTERRSGTDRRKAGLRGLFSGPHRRRRSGGRRSTDRGYVDIYDGRTWAVALAVLVLSFCDSVMTVLQISAGTVREGNPLLYGLLERGGPWVFFGVKAAMTAFAMAIIVLHKEWRFGRAAARACLWLYIGISLYHLYLVLVHASLGALFPLL